MTATTHTTVQPKTAKRIPGALLRYRVLAWITGIWLLVLTTEMLYKYLYLPIVLDRASSTAPGWLFYIGQAHGVFYMIYLAMVVDLAIKVRWPARRTVLTLLAGTVPFVSFVVEHKNTAQIRRDFIA